MARGGARPGAGRKKKPAHLRSIQGGRGSNVIVPPIDPPSDEVLKLPAWLTDPAAVVMWNELSPQAFERRTLTPSTVRALGELCRKFSIAEKLGAVELGGTAHARMLKQINTEMLQFGLTPSGKPLFEAKKPEQAKPVGLARFLNRA